MCVDGRIEVLERGESGQYKYSDEKETSAGVINCRPLVTAATVAAAAAAAAAEKVDEARTRRSGSADAARSRARSRTRSRARALASVCSVARMLLPFCMD